MDEPQLFDYGIHNEASHIRAHVAPLACCVFIFPTISAKRYIERNHGKLKSVAGFQDGVKGKTSEGFLVKPRDIDHVRIIRLQKCRVDRFHENMTTTEKGDAAVEVVMSMLKEGRFPIWFDGQFMNDLETQITGTDILIAGRWHIEVKCDYRASEVWGQPHPKCTGNLFLQTAERNPLRRF